LDYFYRDDAGRISANFHNGARLRHRGQRLRLQGLERSCFVEDEPLMLYVIHV